MVCDIKISLETDSRILLVERLTKKDLVLMPRKFMNETSLYKYLKYLVTKSHKVQNIIDAELEVILFLACNRNI